VVLSLLQLESKRMSEDLAHGLAADIDDPL